MSSFPRIIAGVSSRLPFRIGGGKRPLRRGLRRAVLLEAPVRTCGEGGRKEEAPPGRSGGASGIFPFSCLFPGLASHFSLTGAGLASTLSRLFGTWLSLVEYLNGVQGVVGSNPAVPTILPPKG